MIKSPIVNPTPIKGWVSRQFGLGNACYDLDAFYSPDTGYGQSVVLDLASPKFEPNKSYIFDKSRFNNHGTITGATWVRLNSGWVLSFDGTDDLVAANGVASGGFFGGAFVIMAWGKLSDWAANHAIFGGGRTAVADNYVTIQFLTATKIFKAEITVGVNTNSVDSAGTYDNDASMHLVAMSVDADGHINDFQIDGVSQGTDSTNALDLSAFDKFYVGQVPYNVANVAPMQGQIGLTRVLSGTTIPSVFNQERHLFGV